MKHQAVGFTLVEIVVTIFIIGVTTAAIANIFVNVQHLQHQASYTDLATRAAQREIETLRNDNYSSLNPGQNINFTNQLPAALPTSRTGTAIVSQPATDLRRVDVTVSYSVGGSPHNVVLSALIGAIGITK